MRTEELINLLAADSGPVARALPQRRLAVAGAAGGALALALVLAWLQLRPDLAQAVTGSVFWVKAAYAVAIAGGGFWAAERLSRPGAAAGRAWALIGLVVFLFAAAGAVQLLGLEPGQRLAELRGGSWTVCSRNILTLGAPITLAALVALRGLAPTRPVAAGLAAGTLAGGLSAAIYSLHCTETGFGFVALWYTLGIAACALVGALLGRWALRW